MHKALLRRWCDAMLKYQLHDTGDTRLDCSVRPVCGYMAAVPMRFCRW